jgi:hypothetical protein
LGAGSAVDEGFEISFAAEDESGADHLEAALKDWLQRKISELETGETHDA